MLTLCGMLLAGARCAHVPVQALRRATTAPVLPVRKHLSVTVCAASLPKQDDWRQTHKRLLDLFVEQTIQYVATTSGQGITRGEALTCLQQPQLLASSPPYPGLFRHLYRTFRQRKVSRRNLNFLRTHGGHPAQWLLSRQWLLFHQHCASYLHRWLPCMPVSGPVQHTE